MLDGLLLWHLGAAAALELLPACDGGNADAALVRPLLHGANEGRWFEVPSLALPLPIVTVAFASPMPAVALVDTMVRAYLREYVPAILLGSCGLLLGSCGRQIAEIRQSLPSQ